MPHFSSGDRRTFRPAFTTGRALVVALALGFAFMRDQWSQAVIVEVYTLHTALTVLGFYLALRWWREPKHTRLVLLGLVLGLGLSNHHTMLALGVGIAPLLLLQTGGLRLMLKRATLLGGALVLGLLPYAYLPIAASRNPAMNWGDPSNLERLVTHITRGQYKQAAKDDLPPPQTWERIQSQLEVLWDHATGQGALLLVIGGALALLVMTRRRPATGFLFLSVALLNTLGIIWYTNFNLDYEDRHVVRIFFVPAYLAAALALGLVLPGILERLPRRTQALALAAVLGISVSEPLVRNHEICDFSDLRVVEDYALALLDEAPPNSVIFPSADHATFPLIYQQVVKGLRQDIVNADPYGYVDDKILARAGFDVEALREEAEKRGWKDAVLLHLVCQSTRPVLYTIKKGIPRVGDARLVHAGLWYRLSRPGPEGTDWDPSAAWSLDRARRIREEGEGGNLEFSAQLVCADIAYAEARELYRRDEDYEAKKLLLHSASLNEGSKEHLNNLGSAAAENEDFETAKKLYWQARYLDFDYETATRNLAIVSRATSDWDGLIKILNLLLKKNEKDPFVFKEFMAAMEGLEDWPNFVQYALRHAQLTGEAESAHRAGIVALNELKDRKLALRCMKLVVELDPKDETAQILLAQLEDRPMPTPMGAAPKVPGLAHPEGPQPIGGSGFGSFGGMIRPSGNTFNWGRGAPEMPSVLPPQPAPPSGAGGGLRR